MLQSNCDNIRYVLNVYQSITVLKVITWNIKQVYRDFRIKTSIRSLLTILVIMTYICLSCFANNICCLKFLTIYSGTMCISTRLNISLHFLCPCTELYLYFKFFNWLYVWKYLSHNFSIFIWVKHFYIKMHK